MPARQNIMLALPELQSRFYAAMLAPQVASKVNDANLALPVGADETKETKNYQRQGGRANDALFAVACDETKETKNYQRQGSRANDALFAVARGDTPLIVETDLDTELCGDPQRNARRLEAYRRNVFSNLCSALALSYPVTQRIVGDAFFREVARSFVRAEPSRSGDLNDYGASFANFIADYPHATDLPYLAHVARLEWKLQLLELAADNPSPLPEMPFAALATTPADRYDALFFELDSAVVRMDSDWPLADIWRVNQADFGGDMQIDFSCGCRLLLWRTPRRAELAALGAAEAALLDALIVGRTLAPAVNSALEIDASFALGECLQRWIAAGVLRGAFFDPERS